jgi:spore germination cell wall hydrolase CwlJ-like protein
MFALAAQDTLILLSSEQPGAADRRGLKIAAAAGGGLALGAAACAAVLVIAPPAPAPVETGERVVVALREAPDPTATPAQAPRAAVVKAAEVRKAGELECLTQAVYFEARGEPATGQAAVAQVVMNRVRHPAFPKTVCGVVYQGARTHGCQFSFACDGIPDRITEPGPWKEAQDLAAKVVNDEGAMFIADVGTATHYHAVYVRPFWARRMKKTDKIGNHIFYKTYGGGWS